MSRVVQLIDRHMGHGSPTTPADPSQTTDYTPGKIDSKGNYVPTDDEVTAFQETKIPWAEQVKYGYYTLAFLCGMLVLFTITNLLWKARVRYRKRFPGYSKLSALMRLGTYPRLSPGWWDWIWSWGSLGPNLILFAGLLVASCITWINEYYYFPPFYGSAPLYLRSEWIAMATLPFVYALGSKRNVISVLTGVSHEKLQVLHQGAAVNFVYMSLVHTIAACIRAQRQHGMVLTLKINEVYVSGFVALAPMLLLFIGALPPFRKYAYETFWYVHVVMAVFFIAALFWHGYQLLDSDAYCIVTIILFLGAALWRGGMMVLNNTSLHTARLTHVGPDTARLSIPTYAMKWRPGQHVFLRFPAVRGLESHPFTVASVGRVTNAKEVESMIGKKPRGQIVEMREMVFLIRAQAGFTRALVEHSLRTFRGDYAVLIDGPYGHNSATDLAAFDSVLMCIGGSGISWAVGVLQGIAAQPRRPATIRLVWAVRDQSALSWFNAELTALRATVDIEIYITGATRPSTPHHAGTSHSSPDKTISDLSTPAESPVKEEMPSLFASHHGRPGLKAIIDAWVRAGDGSLAVAACGPQSLLADCANAVSHAEVDILMGRLPNVDELFLASEAYGW